MHGGRRNLGWLGIWCRAKEPACSGRTGGLAATKHSGACLCTADHPPTRGLAVSGWSLDLVTSSTPSPDVDWRSSLAHFTRGIVIALSLLLPSVPTPEGHVRLHGAGGSICDTKETMTNNQTWSLSNPFNQLFPNDVFVTPRSVAFALLNQPGTALLQTLHKPV